MGSEQENVKTTLAEQMVKPEANPASRTQKFWHIKAGTVPTDDPLLGCLVVLTRIEHRPFSPETLSAGLPLVDNKLTPELFVRAAKRAKLSAQIVSRSLEEISALVLPAVLLLKNQHACLLVGWKKGNVAQVIQPETGDGLREIKLEYLKQHYTGHAIFTRPSYQFDLRSEDVSMERSKHWFWSVMRKIIPLYSEIIVASLLVNLFAVCTPLFVMNVYDRVVPNHAIETLWVLAVGMLTVYGFDFLMKNLRAYFVDLASKKADVILSSNIFEQMMGLRMDSRPESVGSFANHISQFDTFREFMTSTTIITLIDLPFIFIFLSIIYAIGGSLVWIPIVAIPVVLIVSFLIQIPLNHLVKASYKYAAQKQSMLIETLVGVETIKSVGAESPMQRRWESIIGMASKYQTRLKMLSNLASHFSMFAQQMCGISMIIVGVYHISEGLITMGALIACNILSSRTVAPLIQISGIITRYDQAMTALNSVDSIMKMPVDRMPGKTPLYRDQFHGALEFQQVSFQYPGQSNKACENISFSVRAGEKIGIVGRIGSGKTTLQKLIMGFYQPNEGHILLDGTEIQQLDLASIRRNIGYVPQDVLLFYGSVKDNIVMGAPYADDQTILRAAGVAGVNEFVSQDSKGFDLPVGERGEKLSGGQRQSIAIARALLLDPPIIVLDEPTNMMDGRTEELFKIKFAQVSKEKTVIISTHKMSLLSLVDRVIFMDQGKIIADGPRDAVIKAISEGKLTASPGK